MSGVSSPVYGSGGGSSIAKPPSTVAYFAGEIRNNPVDWGNGGVLATVWDPSVASNEIAEDTQISGGLWATATGLEFRDGTNAAPLDMSFGDTDEIALALEVLADGAMRLGRV